MLSKRTFIPQGSRYTLPYDIPYYCQFTTPELVLDIIRGRFQASDDPRWTEFGASGKEEYDYWSWQACGIACFKSAIEALGGPVRSMMDWLNDCLSINGFIYKEKVAAGKPSGWIHAALAQLAQNYGFEGMCETPVQVTNIVEHLQRNRFVLASVSHQLGEWDDITRSSGHLVLVHGYSVNEGKIEALRIHNPSGRYEELRANCWILAHRFTQAFSKRIIIFFGVNP